MKVFTKNDVKPYSGKTRLLLQLFFSWPQHGNTQIHNRGINRRNDHFYRSEFKAGPMPISKKTVGIDLGLNDLFITSDGEKSGNPRHTKRYGQKLAYLSA